MTQKSCICSAPLYPKAFSENFDIHHCTQCGSCHFVPSASATRTEFQYDQSSEKYSQNNYLYGKQLRWSHLEILKDDWHGRKVLEIGCFNGFFLDELNKRGAEVFGFDVNRDALSVGKGLFNLTGRLSSDIQHLKAQGPFDDVICIDLVEHLDHPETFIGEVSAMLKSGGRIFVAGPIVERRFHDKSDYPPHHKWWFSKMGLNTMLSRGGYIVISTRVQYDGLLFFRNLLGKFIHGFSKREFHGENVVAAPEMNGIISRNVYAGIGFVGILVFRILRISYCSAILVGRKAG